MKRIKLSRQNIYLLIIAIIVIMAYVYFFIYIPRNKISPILLGQKEVNEYQGENLSSINDFRENSIKGVQYIDKDKYQLKISGLVEKNKNYTYNQLINNFTAYQKMVTLNCVEGWSVKILWQGFLISDLINQVKPLPSAKVVIFKAVDGYSTSFPIDYLINNKIILAYKMNDVTLPAERGFPLQLVAENKWGYKWIKWITEIEFSNDVNYEGYWEQRGYSDTGNLNENFIK